MHLARLSIRASALSRLTTSATRSLPCTRSLAASPITPLRRLCTAPPNPLQPPSAWTQFWTWTLQQRPSWRESPAEAAVIFTVFGITGSTSVAVVRPALKSTIGLEGSMREGPWSYRVLSLLLVSPIYATFLVTFGTLAGRHLFFAAMARKIFGRFLPSQLGKNVGCGPTLRAAAKPPSPPPPPSA